MILVLITLVIATAISAVLTFWEIPVLHRLKTGQNIREEGPEAHKAKAGTPSMGGLSMIATIVLMGIVLLLRNLGSGFGPTIIAIILLTLAYGAIGFYDDYLKIVKHQNEGLNVKEKFKYQIMVGLIFSVFRYLYFGSKICVPFTNTTWDFGFFIIPFTLFVFVAMTNAVNLTDGLDGLASSVTMNASLVFAVLCLGAGGILGFADCVNPFAYNTASGFMSVILMGSCIGFLIFNRHPAKLFMGDTGSLALGACLTGIAMTSNLDLALPIVGIIYVCEALSVIIQVYVFKTQNGRRFFRMTPIHHHFELGGWSEVKVDTVFALTTLGMGIIAILIF